MNIPEREIVVPLAGRDFRLAAPDPTWVVARADAADELGEVEANPYWGDLWPSALALGGYLAERADDVRGRSVVELGCGLGFCTVVAAILGAQPCLATDLVPEALEFAAINAERHGVARRCRFERLDWRTDGLPVDAEIVFGADILFDPAAVESLALLLRRGSASARRLLIAEPVRPCARGFFDRAKLPIRLVSVCSTKAELAGHEHRIDIYDVILEATTA